MDRSKIPDADIEVEVETDPSAAVRAGFTVLDLRPDDDAEPARIIAREMIPEIAARLGPPAPGFRYALTDIDGDGAPELVLLVMHWKVCGAGCPTRIYKFESGAWKLLTEQMASLVAVKPPASAKDKPQVAFLTNDPNAHDDTVTAVFQMEGGKFVAKGKLRRK